MRTRIHRTSNCVDQQSPTAGLAVKQTKLALNALPINAILSSTQGLSRKTVGCIASDWPTCWPRISTILSGTLYFTISLQVTRFLPEFGVCKTNRRPSPSFNLGLEHCKSENETNNSRHNTNLSQNLCRVLDELSRSCCDFDTAIFVKIFTSVSR